VKFCYLKPLGWHGFEESATGSIYAVAPLARLNVAEGMATPNAQKAYEEFFSILGAKPVHHTLANHWARIVEMIYAAERMLELVNDPEITHRKIREIPKAKPRSGIGVVEAPRGTLFHHFETDDQGLITKANLIVATQNNAARIAMSVDKAARGLIKKGQINEGLLNMVEMAFRAYDPCFGCATHALPGHVPLQVNIYDRKRRLLRQLIQS
jgi:F420-non-reducing hydrogenase large subunit